jgi:hypothetical protein
MTDTHTETPEKSPGDSRPAEFKILGALWRWSVPILFVTALVAGTIWSTSDSEVPLRTVQSELLVRMGYEYTPVPWTASSDSQQINFRADEVIGTEIQLLTSEGTIQQALQTAPHPTIGTASDGTFDADQLRLTRQKLAVKRLEGSNVILIEVVDPDPAWSISFSQSLLDAYLARRAELFANATYDQLLEDDAARAATAAASLNDESRQISQRIAETVAYLDETAAVLAASPALPELRAALERDIRGLQIYIGAMDNSSSLQDAIQQVEQTLDSRTAPDFTAGTTTRISGDLLTAAVDQLTKDATRLNAIGSEREVIAKQLDTVRTAKLRKSLRDSASNKMTIMTPPRLLARTSGIDRVQKTAIAGLMTLILASLLFVYLDGLSRPSAR